MTDCIHHIATVEEWEAAPADQPYRHASLDTEGFIHCSTAAQLPHTIARYFAPSQELVILDIDPELLGSEVRWELAPIGEHFPHVYGPIDREAIVAVNRSG